MNSRRSPFFYASVIFGLALFAAPTLADPPSSAPPSAPHESARASAPGDALQLLPPDSVTRHAAELAGRRLDYVATAGSLPLFGAKGELAAKVFYVAYTMEGAAAAGRPITFVFNGGPGAASAFLHLGALGPRAVNFTANGSAPARPVRFTDNPDSWLEFTDLVFVDPVGAGYSRAAAGDEADHAFFGVEKDAVALTSAIRLYLARNGRSLAQVLLAGESYGGFRVTLLANRLLQAGVDVKGLCLISPALDFSLLNGGVGNPLPLALDLPAIAASHIELRDGVNGSLDSLKEVERFARTEYLVYLASGIKPNDAVYAALARYTGVEPDVIAKRYGRVTPSLFASEYARRNDRVLSRYDGSVSAAAPRPTEDVNFDPILDGAVAVLTPAMTSYARSELGFVTDLQYHLLNREVSRAWDFGTKRQGFASAIDELQEARTHNPALRIFVVHGYTDLVTTYGASKFLIDQLHPVDGAPPVMFRVYRGGHMMYLRSESRRLLREDAREHYQAALE